MAANSRLAGAVQALCVIAYSEKEGLNSESIARSLDTNPVVVRRLLKSLEQKGLVELRPGRNGGVALKRSPEDITLGDIYDAVEEGEAGVFALREQGNPRCAVNRAMQTLLPEVFESANQAVASSLRRTKLSTLVKKI